MSRRFRVVGPNDPPRVQVAYFYENPSVRDSVIGLLGTRMTYLSQRFWIFSNDGEGKTAAAVGRLIDGITRSEYSDISTFQGRAQNLANTAETLGFLTLTRKAGVQIVEADAITSTIITATNTQLQALESPLHLPLERPTPNPTPLHRPW
ncbi:MAG TPA: hypothetical protein VLG11_06130 [Candidatus Saccharimonadales bacterium]|nr:hypothetical protein [Candidatus Saccharimonadales bacterium]